MPCYIGRCIRFNYVWSPLNMCHKLLFINIYILKVTQVSAPLLGCKIVTVIIYIFLFFLYFLPYIIYWYNDRYYLVSKIYIYMYLYICDKLDWYMFKLYKMLISNFLVLRKNCSCSCVRF